MKINPPRERAWRFNSRTPRKIAHIPSTALECATSARLSKLRFASVPPGAVQPSIAAMGRSISEVGASRPSG
jgi:hypothetical protein